MTTAVPYKQIRALYTDTTITVYQAYSSTIASAAVDAQKLNASSAFSMGRMTWIKPSFLWCMYRSGWSFKDARQERILALEMTHAAFEKLLASASVNAASHDAPDVHSAPVRVQWDPERSLREERLPYRSIQIGIGRDVVAEWVENGIVSIRDVTEDVRRWRLLLDEGGDEGEKTVREEIPVEKEYVLPENLQWVLK